MGLVYVNHRGERISTDAGGKAPKSRRPRVDVYHKGWRAVGFSPAQLAEARAAHARSADANKPFDEGMWMRNAKPVPIRSKPYELFSAAQECAELAAKAGWKGAHVVEIAKGGR